MRAASTPAGTLRGSMADELELYKRYLKALSGVAEVLLEGTSEQNLTEVLQLLVANTGIGCCALFLNKPEKNAQGAKLYCTWSSAEAVSQLSDFMQFRDIDYQKYPLLFDTLHAGMVFSKNIAELPLEEATLFCTQQIHTALCIPLLMQDKMEGFLGLFSRNEPRNWLPIEVNVLCAITNSLALALVRKRAEQNLEASSERLKALVGATEDMIIEYDLNGHIVNVWSDNSSLSIGLAPVIAGSTLEQALPDDMTQVIRRATPKLLAGSNRETFEFTLNIDSTDRFFLGRLQMLPSETGQTRNIVALIRDITELMREEAQRLSMLETLNLLEEAIIDLSLDGLLLNFSGAWNKLLDLPSGHTYDHLGKPLMDFVYQDDRPALVSAIHLLASGKKHSEAVRFRLLQGQDPVWIEAHLLAHHSLQGQITALRGVLRDITSSYLQERRITQMALHDALTQLPNRILLEEHLQQSIARAQRGNEKVALGFIDVDYFKHINDTLGHKAGDIVLVTLSKRLQSVLREIDTLSRWGGDEFVVLLPDASSEDDIRRIAERMRKAALKSIDLDGIETRITLSIGLAVYPDDADSAETLMSMADHTMFHAKSVGRNNVQFFQDIRETLKR